ncbi:MAG: ATP-binding protein [FCB group bacterium]|nr:ATP-binding protein [FCB group bacterium]
MDLVIATAPVLIIKANPLIAEVFKNYISNAIKYARDGKRIVIESVIENQAVIVRVKDFGKTIAKADREQVFQRQVQLENGKERGRGLGLAIVKRIAAAHDGEVWVEPNTPKGNSFCLRIPR